MVSHWLNTPERNWTDSCIRHSEILLTNMSTKTVIHGDLKGVTILSQRSDSMTLFAIIVQELP